jgi:hypothetical protein
MEKQCVLCHILLDIACVAPGCPGHHNESVGDTCAYCATHERDAGFFWLFAKFEASACAR